MSSIYQGLLWSIIGLAAAVGLLSIAAKRSGKKVDFKKELIPIVVIWVIVALILTVVIH